MSALAQRRSHLAWEGIIRQTAGLNRERVQVTVLVACASLKGDRPAPARELYVSTLFRKSMRMASLIANKPGDRIAILSARHGLVDPDTEIEPYDHRLSPRDSAEAWAWGVVTQLESLEATGGRDVFPVILAGAVYADPIVNEVERRHAGKRWDATRSRVYAPHTPLSGLEVGERLAMLTARIGWAERGIETFNGVADGARMHGGRRGS